MSAWEVVSAAVAVVLASTLAGHAAWRLAGAREWSWTAPAVGLGTLLALCGIAVELPGEGTAGAVGVTIAAAAGAGVAARTRAPWRELALVGGLGLLVGALPFLAAGHGGILAVTDNGDLAGHVILAEALRTGGEPAGLPAGWETNYPTGSHALVASIATLVGADVDAVFMGLLVALVAIGALTALAALRAVAPARRALGALLVAAPYLTAAYLAQASHKETLVGVLTLGFALALPSVRSARAALALVALAAGAFAAYSFVGLQWPLLTGVGWLALVVAADRRLPTAAALRRAALPAAALVLLLALAVAPQLGRASALVGAVLETAQGATSGGNVRAELPAYEVFGIWPHPDPRPLGTPAAAARLLAGLAGVVFAWGGWWCWRRRRLELLAAAGACLAVYVQARLLSTAYYSGKALSVAAVPVMAVAVAALLHALPPVRAIRAGTRSAAALGGAAFLALAAWSSALALRYAAVAPPGKTAELESLRPLVEGRPTFFFGRHDYVHWLLRGAPVASPFTYLGQAQVAFEARPEKAWQVPHTFDWDAVTAASLDSFAFVIAPRTGYASAPPPNWRRVRATRSYELFRRAGPTPVRQTLQEVDAPGAVLDCSTPQGRALAATGGIAAVRARPVEVRPAALRFAPRELSNLRPVRFAKLRAGRPARAAVDLPPGRWETSLQYMSPWPVSVTVAGQTVGGPASMEGAGGFWSLGTVRSPGGRQAVTIEVERAPLLSARRFGLVGRLALTRAGERGELVPLRRACGRWVDWFRAGQTPGAPGPGRPVNQPG